MKKSLALGLALVSLSGAPLIAEAGGAYTVTIEKAHVNTTSGFYFKTVETMQDPDDCTSSTPIWYQINPTGEYSKELYATVLSAKALGRSMEIYLTDCIGTYPQVLWGNIQ